MATYYLYSGAGGTATGADWTNAFLTLTAALAAATASGDLIKVHKTHTDSVAVNTTWTCQNNISIICVDKDSSDALAQMDGSTGYIGNTGTSYDLYFVGGYKVYWYGISIVLAGSAGKQNRLANTDNADWVFDSCSFKLTSTGACYLLLGNAGAVNINVRLNNCTIRFGATLSAIRAHAKVEFNNFTVDAAGSAPSTLLQYDAGGFNGSPSKFNGCDLSKVTGTLVGATTLFNYTYIFSNCKFGSGVTVFASPSIANASSGEVFVFDCSSGDNHYEFGHYNALGSVVSLTSPYVSDGALYDGTNHVSWKIVTTSAATIYNPYVSPWIEKYHSGTSAITPSIEGLKINNAVVAQDDEVWAEFSYQGTTGYTLSTIVNDRMTLLGTAADQTSSKTYSDWTASPATDSGDSVFKLLSPSITPAEIGMLMARVCVGAPSVTVYVDPKIRT